MRFYLSAAALLCFDQMTKVIVVRRMEAGGSVPVIQDILHLTLVRNTGAAFGMFRDMPALFMWISILAAVFINVFYLSSSKHLNAKETAGLCLILAGTVGNLIDRVRLGYVVDFLDLRVWPVFNLADTWITVGAVLLGAGVMFGRKTRGDDGEV
ncbi:MAG: signal peptidase II [Candidatus Omnitrophica bacterium]|nr:signal peptidase II [Candidatus Omnitrophota bacterium]